MAMATTSVIFYSEVPLLHQSQERTHIHTLRWILIPHAVAGMLALLIGPAQFSSSIRHRSLKLHRALGSLYVGSVFIAAPLAVLATLYSNYPRANIFKVAIAVQASAWVVTTGVALFAVLKSRIAQHQQWMVRSYAVTFTFVGTRVLQPIPAWNRLGRVGFAAAIVCITGLAAIVPEIACFASRLVEKSLKRAQVS